ncbi:MAG TPA: RagB/SusD family nutrient uptake outer membrane protein [Puia sp.]|nr:RagB/SusD family nutrient uptake outer membrane protein [Puia sp.]
MNKIYYGVLLGSILSLGACKKDYGDLNHATVEQFTANATVSELNNLVSGTESGMRSNLTLYLDDVGTIGRELYHLSISEPRYVTDLLGANDATLSNSNFYITNIWASRYQVVKNCNILIQSATNSKSVTAAQRSGYLGFARMIKAYQLLLILNLTDSNGIRVDVSDPDHLGPIVGYDDALTAIASLLDSSKNDLGAAEVAYTLAGFGYPFNDAAGLTKVNRALAARVAVYRQKWADAQTYLSQSFYDPLGDPATGVYNVFGTGNGDQLNTFFVPRNSGGDTRVAHPSYAADIVADDDRIGKAPLRDQPALINGITGDRDVWVYTTNTTPIPIIRNEELQLIDIEADIQLSQLPDAITGINTIRQRHNLTPYSGAVTKDALITEMLYERRYSLYCEGHRWVDMRRYGRLNQLPLDQPEDDVWTKFPLPVTEQP